MGVTATAPNAAHHAFNTELNALAERYAAMPAMERVALVAQFLGAQLTLVNTCSTAEAMYAVSANMATGNAAAAQTGDLLTVEHKG